MTSSNSYMQYQWQMFDAMRTMRDELLNALTDADLAFSPGGQNMTLGALCKQQGEIDHSYIESLKTLKQEWSYRNTEPGIETSIARLKAWFDTMLDDLHTTVFGFSEDELKQNVDRGGFGLPIDIQLGAYQQALLVFFGKATIYLRAMDKPLPEKIRDWIW